MVADIKSERWPASSRNPRPASIGIRKKDVLDKLPVGNDLQAPARYIVTKHMYWPVKAGRLSAIPVWHDYHDAKYLDYDGYETWLDLIGVDPSNQSVRREIKLSYLYGVFHTDPKTGKPAEPWPTMTAPATIHGINEFYYHQITQADWDSFDDADKAILNAASYWAYNESFGVGDYLVTIAMHINTKEVPTWALQSVWWSDRADAGLYAADRPKLPQATGPWDHYLLVDSYGIPERPGSKLLPLAANFYIELVIHRVGTECNNCHIRAGWPKGDRQSPEVGKATYQNPDCANLLEALLTDSACLKALKLTDFQWIITDRAK